ncbi:sigma factor [Actinoallomurus acaciae]|uniref:Sigma factor n=1 Tax=Actinoallomurus acaciae TaxID=502577 RepID=A0ABV5YV76_9ACTN
MRAGRLRARPAAPAARRVPRRPGAWLTTTARNRAIDRLRREAVGAGRPPPRPRPSPAKPKPTPTTGCA